MTTSLNYYKRAKQLLQQHPECLESTSPQPQHSISQAEALLGVSFPPTYCRFLLDYGTLCFAGEEIYGIPKNPMVQVVPNMIGITLKMRQRGDIPDNGLVLYAVGEGTFLGMLVQGQEDDQCPIISFIPGSNRFPPLLETEASSFGEWFYTLISQALEDAEQDIEE